jgi:hypothetical protein
VSSRRSFTGSSIRFLSFRLIISTATENAIAK